MVDWDRHINKNTPLMEIVSEISQIPDLDEGTIHIWGIHVPDMLDRLDALCAVLSGNEREKAERFRGLTDRQSSIAARGALRILLSRYSGIPAKNIKFEYTENGKPHLVDSDIDFNVSHSGEWVVLAIGCNRNIGVDVEQIKTGLDVVAIGSRYFTPEENKLVQKAENQHTTFFNLWARKEAYVKACGSTLFRELSTFAVPVEDEEKNGWHFRRLEAGSKYAAAIVTDKEPVNVPCYDFGGLKWDS